jgi:hypothetical protein
MKKTAIEWLIEQLYDKKFLKYIPYNLPMNGNHLENLIQQAKEMEFSQTEILNEEIEKAGQQFSWDFRGSTEYELSAFIEGAKWYRQQIKNKRNIY